MRFSGDDGKLLIHEIFKHFQGDEGAPVTVREANRIFLIGVHSFHYSGIRGCDRGRSTVNTRITEYLDWIAQNSDVVIPA